MNVCILLTLLFLAIASAQGQSYGRRGRGGGSGRHGCPRGICGGGGERPPWCPPQIFCFVNPCTVMTCPAYPSAVCINDDPCQRACSGNFYIGRRRLDYRQCNYRG